MNLDGRTITSDGDEDEYRYYKGEEAASDRKQEAAA
jgi:hypothetical protein